MGTSDLNSLLDQAKKWQSRPHRNEFQLWCQQTKTHIANHDILSLDLSKVFSSCAKYDTQPPTEWVAALDAHTIEAIDKKMLPPHAAFSMMHSYASLCLKPPADLIDYCLAKIAELHPPDTQNTQGIFESRVLMDMAMINAYYPNTIDAEKVDLAFAQLSHITPDICSEGAQEQLHTAAKFFQKDKLAQACYATLKTRNTIDSGLQGRVTEAVRDAIKKFNARSFTKPKITLREEAVHPHTGTPVDLLVEVENAQGKAQQFWLQVDGPTHYIRTANGDIQLNGKSHLQKTIGESYPEAGKFIRIGYDELSNAREIAIFAEKFVQEAVASSIQATDGRALTGKRPRLRAPSLVSAAPASYSLS